MKPAPTVPLLTRGARVPLLTRGARVPLLTRGVPADARVPNHCDARGRDLAVQKALMLGIRRFEMTTRWMFPVPSKMS